MNQQSHRKNEHVSLAEKFHSDYDQSFDDVRLIHRSLPEISANEVDPKTSINNGKLTFQWPFYIEAMTGGSKQAAKINDQLSRIAQTTGIAMACGSESVALADPNVSDSFQIIRKNLTNQPVIANLGANHDYQIAQKAVDLINADALEIHVNVIQEMVMPEGDRDFYWLDNIQKIVQNVNVPVIVKEVGFGMDKDTIRQLTEIGVQNVNVSGRGGTNFAKIENFRRPNKEFAQFAELGQTTVESLLEANNSQIDIIASGGIKSGLDIVKCLVLGAKTVGIAGQVLHSLIKNGEESTTKMIRDWQLTIKTLMTILGCRTIDELKQVPVVFSPSLINYIEQRQLNLKDHK